MTRSFKITDLSDNEIIIESYNGDDTKQLIDELERDDNTEWPARMRDYLNLEQFLIEDLNDIVYEYLFDFDKFNEESFWGYMNYTFVRDKTSYENFDYVVTCVDLKEICYYENYDWGYDMFDANSICYQIYCWCTEHKCSKPHYLKIEFSF